jgi:Na+/H+ antiporter NhaC
MNGLQIYILGCLIAYPIAFNFLKMYSRASKNKNLVDELQNQLEEGNAVKNKNFFKNYLIAVIVLLSWIMVIVWSYFKIKLLYYFVCNNLFRK